MEVDLNELIENMSDDDRNKIMTFIEENERKQGFFEQVHSLTDKCFDVCMPDAKGSLNKAGEVCVANCVNRFMDATKVILKNLSYS